MKAATYSCLALVLSAVSLPSCSEAPIELAGDSATGETVASSQEPVLQSSNIFGNGLPNKTVVLTYDDGPDEHTLELATYLNQQGIKATFFINGSRFCKVWTGDVCTQPHETRPCNDGVEQAPVASRIYYRESVLDELTALGHRIGNHTTDHCHLTGQDDPEDFVFELATTQAIVDRHVCDGLFVFRAPFGNWDAQAANLAKADSTLDKLIGPVNWDVDGGDWDCFQKGTSVQACGDKYISLLNNRANQNGIFLHHDRLEFNVGIDGPLKLAQYIVPKLKEQGYAFSTLDALLNHTPQGPLACPTPMGGTGGMGGMGGAGGGAGSGGAGGVGGTAGAGFGGTGGASAGSSGSTASGVSGSGGAGGTAPVTPQAGAPPTFTPTATEDESSCGLARGSNRGSYAIPALLALTLLSRRRRQRG